MMTEQQRCERYIAVMLRRPRPSRILLAGWLDLGGSERTYYLVLRRMGLREENGQIRRMAPTAGALCGCEASGGGRRPLLLDGSRCSKCGRRAW